ncbi:hypothetical protein KCN56_03085 [Photobacterium galatheae]|uniref:hypothetical protein n=1 Tax=Photobacterium galatheae TaxID=1654360 RepID=UPI00202D089B|nr:hypothetical protein [Photobacterium galatheae]MCM0147555.1 hypothetical protein [Photobacterium galatheae]
MLTTLTTLTGLSLLPLTPGSATDSISPFVRIDSQSYAENNSIYALVKGKESDYQGAHHAFTLNESSVGLRYQNLTFSYFYRYEWFLKHSPDALLLYGESVNRTDMIPDKTYQVDLNVNHSIQQGVRLGWRFEATEQFAIYLAGSYINATDLMEGQIHGQVTRSQNNDITGQLDLNYVYGEDVLLDRIADKPTSRYGFSSDLGMDWQASDHWFLSAFAQDLYGQIIWDHAPYTTAVANTATAETDESGYININPIASGFEGYKEYKQRLTPKYRGSLSYLWSQTAFSVGHFYGYGAELTDLSITQSWDNFSAQLSYTLQSQAIGLVLTHPYWGMTVVSDSLDYQQASQLTVTLYGQLPF